jgi:hypothetical protein
MLNIVSQCNLRTYKYIWYTDICASIYLELLSVANLPAFKII